MGFTLVFREHYGKLGITISLRRLGSGCLRKRDASGIPWIEGFSNTLLLFRNHSVVGCQRHSWECMPGSCAAVPTDSLGHTLQPPVAIVLGYPCTTFSYSPPNTFPVVLTTTTDSVSNETPGNLRWPETFISQCEQSRGISKRSTLGMVCCGETLTIGDTRLVWALEHLSGLDTRIVKWVIWSDGCSVRKEGGEAGGFSEQGIKVG